MTVESAKLVSFNRTSGLNIRQPVRAFASRDPVGYGAGLNFHQYVSSGPLTMIDALGFYDYPPIDNPGEGVDLSEPDWQVEFIDPEIDVWPHNEEVCDGWLCMLLAAHARNDMIVLGPQVMELAAQKIADHIEGKYARFYSPQCSGDDGYSLQWFEFKENVDFRSKPVGGTTAGGAVIGLSDPLSLDLVLGNANVRCRGALIRDVDCCACSATIYMRVHCQVVDTFDFSPQPNRSPIYNRLARLWEILYGGKLAKPSVFGEKDFSRQTPATPTGCERH